MRHTRKEEETEAKQGQSKNDFSKGSVAKNILSLAVPMTTAQLVNILYNVVDRIYIGRMPENATLSMTGLGLCLPLITLVTAFANLFGMGGAPLCTIARGKGDEKEAETIMGNSFIMLVGSGILLTVLGLLSKSRCCMRLEPVRKHFLLRISILRFIFPEVFSL